MHAMRFLHSHLKKTCPTLHAKRLAVLLKAVDTVTRPHRLTLTALGRALHLCHGRTPLQYCVGPTPPPGLRLGDTILWLLDSPLVEVIVW